MFSNCFAQANEFLVRPKVLIWDLIEPHNLKAVCGHYRDIVNPKELSFLDLAKYISTQGICYKINESYWTYKVFPSSAFIPNSLTSHVPLTGGVPQGRVSSPAPFPNEDVKDLLQPKTKVCFHITLMITTVFTLFMDLWHPLTQKWKHVLHVAPEAIVKFCFFCFFSFLDVLCKTCLKPWKRFILSKSALFLFFFFFLCLV